MQTEIVTDPDAIAAALKRFLPRLRRGGHKAGSLSPWLQPMLVRRGLPAVCLEAWHVRAAMSAQRSKTEATDVLALAHIVRTGRVRQAHIKTESCYRLRLLLTQRRNLRRKVLDLEITIRHSLKAFGIRIKGTGAPARRGRARGGSRRCADQRADGRMLTARALLWMQYRRLHDLVVNFVARQSCVGAIPGVGPVTALSFVTAIDDPSRFRRSRDVAVYFGLTSGRRQSGTSIDVQGRIGKAGDGDVRRALYEAASALMTRFKGCDKVRTWGLALAKRSCHRKATVAVARKLAVIMHAMWTDGTCYVEVGRWTVSPKAETALRELGERGDIIKTMHRALAREGLADARPITGYVLHGEKTSEPIVGRVLDKGLGGDEMGERMRLVIDGVDGRVHHLEMDPARAEEMQRGMIVAAGAGPPGPRAVDRNTLTIAGKEGVYRPAKHLEQAVGTIERLGGDPAAYVRSHVRRLEALRRAGHVERMDAEQWRIPVDLPERGQAYDRIRDRTSIGVLSPMGLEQQTSHDGATWLDRELASRERTALADAGFGREVATAMDRRRRWLTDKGYATDLGDGRIRAPRDLIQRLEARDVERAGTALAAERGREWRPAVPGNYVSGQLVGSTQLSSGRFAMIDDGLGFSLVPWRPVLEQHIGRHISGVATPGGDVNWSLGRKLGLGV